MFYLIFSTESNQKNMCIFRASFPLILSYEDFLSAHIILGAIDEKHSVDNIFKMTLHFSKDKLRNPTICPYNSTEWC